MNGVDIEESAKDGNGKRSISRGLFNDRELQISLENDNNKLKKSSDSLQTLTVMTKKIDSGE